MEPSRSVPCRARSSRVILSCVALGLVLAPAPAAHAESSWGWSPGLKLSWTFGHGLTYGLEVSFIRLPDLEFDPGDSLLEAAGHAVGQLITETWGVVVNLDTTFRGLFRARVGAEWVGPFLGLEAGPALIVDGQGAHLGLGITPWVGYHLLPFYTFTWVFGRAPNQHELGLYLKAPLLGFGGGSTYSDDWDDD
jgi:hypothetical protein